MFRETEVRPTTEDYNDRSEDACDKIVANSVWHPGPVEYLGAPDDGEGSRAQPEGRLDRDAGGFTTRAGTLTIPVAAATGFAPAARWVPCVQPSVDLDGRQGHIQARDMFDTKLSTAFRKVWRLPTGQRDTMLIKSCLKRYEQVVRAYFAELATPEKNLEDCYLKFVEVFLPARFEEDEPSMQLRDWLRACAESHVIAYWCNWPNEEPKPDVNELLEPYRRALYDRFARQGVRFQDIVDCFHEFLLKCLGESGILGQFNPSQVNFRAWLLKSAKHHAIDWLKAKKNRNVQVLEAPDEIPAVIPELDATFKRIWKREVVCRALKNVCNKCMREGEERLRDFRVFIAYYTYEGDSKKTWADVAKEFELPDADAASNKSDWVKRQLGNEILSQIREYASTESQVQEELRDLLAAVGPLFTIDSLPEI